MRGRNAASAASRRLSGPPHAHLPFAAGCANARWACKCHIRPRGETQRVLGAQPRDEDALDPDFLKRLHALLDLTDRNGLHVMLDDHGDMVGSLGCGNGAPAWFQKKAPGMIDLLGKE